MATWQIVSLAIIAVSIILWWEHGGDVVPEDDTSLTIKGLREEIARLNGELEEKRTVPAWPSKIPVPVTELPPDAKPAEVKIPRGYKK